MRKTLNMILTALAAAVMMAWIWKFFGPGGAEARRAGGALLGGAGTSFGGLLWISVSVVCLGYLLWRFMSWFFWHKYFREDPPDRED
ncbi:hypothetical protein [Cloacibacillus sp. An23]|uniref:hypothetical protein n=1 Tax=Cloacibacillus sp. An23 TaxID=1965591 RepID=UPI000B39EBFC|nr:hypothetical protein [Cloacibacillus sp. An23]OUO92980.1 hypothetical protein B5F39_08990 [Cloacibacillus sp. An23]